ncbi:MAG: oligosaccharide flippase family protein [Acidobacteriota bacterium]
MSAVTSPAPIQRGGFLSNVLWSWVSIGVSLVSAFVLSPLILRRLGDDDYGLWTVTTALVEYYWLLDFGLRSATVRYTAHYNGAGETDKLNVLLSTAMVYNACLLPILIGGTWLGRDKLADWGHIHNPLFPGLLFAVATAWALTSLFSTFTSTLEGLQRFGVINKTNVVCTLLRTIGILILLNQGHGVVNGRVPHCGRASSVARRQLHSLAADLPRPELAVVARQHVDAARIAALRQS